MIRIVIRLKTDVKLHKFMSQVNTSWGTNRN